MTTGTSAGASKEVDQIPHRRLPFWVALALSVALVGPTLAMSGNGQGLIGTVGKSIPLVFLIGLVGVSLVGYSFVRLTQHLNHAGSAYGLVGGTIGPRTGFFSGFAMLGAYWGFAIGTLALTAAFTNAFIAKLQPGNDNPYQAPWLVIVVVAAAISFLLAGRDIRLLAKILLAIEGIGILSMIVLVIVIFARGAAPSTGIDFSVFSFSGSGVSPSAVIAGVVAAFLSWAGFDAMICDEVKMGLGRPGTLHAFEHDGVVPEIVTFGKVLGGGLPLSAAVGPAELLDEPPAAALLTTAGNPVCTAAGRAVLATIVGDHLAEWAAKVGAVLQERLRALDSDRIGDVRGRGLAIGLELVDPATGDRDPRLAAQVVYRAWELGAVVYYVGGNVLEITPPLVLTESEADRAAEILGDAIADAAAGNVDEAKVAQYAGW
jgi:Aminotransferase class-III/Amino acid permease